MHFQVIFCRKNDEIREKKNENPLKRQKNEKLRRKICPRGLHGRAGPRRMSRPRPPKLFHLGSFSAGKTRI